MFRECFKVAVNFVVVVSQLHILGDIVDLRKTDHILINTGVLNTPFKIHLCYNTMFKTCCSVVYLY